MGYRLFIHKKADKIFDKLPKQTTETIKKKLKTLTTEPRKKGQRLRNQPYYKIRIGDYRAIYEILEEKNQIAILHVGHRSTVYDDFQKFL